MVPGRLPESSYNPSIDAGKHVWQSWGMLEGSELRFSGCVKRWALDLAKAAWAQCCSNTGLMVIISTSKNSQLSHIQGENTLTYSNLMHDYFENINFILLPLVTGLMFLANWNSGSCLFISVCGISLAPWLHSRTPEWRSKRCNRSLGQNILLPLPHRPLFPWPGNACKYVGIPTLLATTLLGSCLLDHPESCWFFPHAFALWEIMCCERQNNISKVLVL